MKTMKYMHRNAASVRVDHRIGPISCHQVGGWLVLMELCIVQDQHDVEPDLQLRDERLNGAIDNTGWPLVRQVQTCAVEALSR